MLSLSKIYYFCRSKNYIFFNNKKGKPDCRTFWADMGEADNIPRLEKLSEKYGIDFFEIVNSNGWECVSYHRFLKHKKFLFEVGDFKLIECK